MAAGHLDRDWRAVDSAHRRAESISDAGSASAAARLSMVRSATAAMVNDGLHVAALPGCSAPSST